MPAGTTARRRGRAPFRESLMLAGTKARRQCNDVGRGTAKPDSGAASLIPYDRGRALSRRLPMIVGTMVRPRCNGLDGGTAKLNSRAASLRPDDRGREPFRVEPITAVRSERRPHIARR